MLPSTETYTLSLHDALPIWRVVGVRAAPALRQADHGRGWQQDAVERGHPVDPPARLDRRPAERAPAVAAVRSEEHTSELQSRFDLVCRLLLEKKKINRNIFL